MSWHAYAFSALRSGTGAAFSTSSALPPVCQRMRAGFLRPPPACLLCRRARQPRQRPRQQQAVVSAYGSVLWQCRVLQAEGMACNAAQVYASSVARVQRVQSLTCLQKCCRYSAERMPQEEWHCAAVAVSEMLGRVEAQRGCRRSERSEKYAASRTRKCRRGRQMKIGPQEERWQRRERDVMLSEVMRDEERQSCRIAPNSLRRDSLLTTSSGPPSQPPSLSNRIHSLPSKER